MVFHVTNYMRETNVWMIRKMRWIMWSIGAAIPIYRNTYWDYLGRRVAWRDSLGFWGTEEEKKESNEKLRAYWGYNPRYTPVYFFSIKQRKQERMTAMENFNDTPRLSPKGDMNEKNYMVPSKDVRMFHDIAMEHNRKAGDFDYNFPQNFYSTFPEIDRETYLSVGSKKTRMAHESFGQGKI